MILIVHLFIIIRYKNCKVEIFSISTTNVSQFKMLCVYIHIYIYVCVCVCVCVYNTTHCFAVNETCSEN